MALPLIGILLSLIFLIAMAYRGHSVVAIAPLAALIAVLFSWEPLLANYTQIFMPALGNFIVNFFPLFLAGAIFGRLMSVSGYAEDIARWIPTVFGQKQAVVVTAIVTALLTYGGVSAWVIAFTVVPIAKPLFRRANVSMKLMPAAIALGIFTFATAALPGSPQIHNAIPTKYFGTTTFAAPVLGVIGVIVTFGLGIAWLKWRENRLLKKGEGYRDISSYAVTHDNSETGSDPLGDSIASATKETARASTLAGSRVSEEVEPTDFESNASLTRKGLLGLLPILVVVLVNALFVYVISPQLNFDYLAEERFGATSLDSVLGLWSVTLGLFVAGLLIFVLQPKRFAQYVKSLTEGAQNAVLPVFTTASEVAYGAVVASLAVFALVQSWVFSVSDNPIIVGVVATAVISGITGSSSGGLSITLQTFGEQLMQMAQDQGLSLEFLHRAMAMASVSLDSLPHNGAIVTLLIVCGMTHRQGYKDIAAVTVLVPAIGVVAIVALGLGFPALA